MADVGGRCATWKDRARNGDAYVYTGGTISKIDGEKSARVSEYSEEIYRFIFEDDAGDA
jgi:hypothetical protein